MVTPETALQYSSKDCVCARVCVCARLCVRVQRLKKREEKGKGEKFLSMPFMYVWAKPLSSDPPPTVAPLWRSLNVG